MSAPCDKAVKNHGALIKELEELGKLTGQLAHEIKNPLSTIKVNLKLIAEQLQSTYPHEPANQPVQ